MKVSVILVKYLYNVLGREIKKKEKERENDKTRQDIHTYIHTYVIMNLGLPQFTFIGLPPKGYVTCHLIESVSPEHRRNHLEPPSGPPFCSSPSTTPAP